MSKSGEQALDAQESEAQAESGDNPYAFVAPPDAPRAVLEDGVLGARVALQDVIGEAAALDDALARLRTDLDRFSGSHVPDALALRSRHLQSRIQQLHASMTMLCVSYEGMQARMRPF